MSGAKERTQRAFDAVEGILHHLHPKEDAHQTAEMLKGHFLTPEAMLLSGAPTLEKLGLRPVDALLLSQIPELTRHIRKEGFEKRVYLGTLKSASPYLAANFHALQVERFYMFCLDRQGRLKERVFLQEGTVDGALFSLKDMLREVVRVEPKAIILSHNHPGRTLRPSQEDINCTMAAIQALTVVGIPLLDHVIIAGEQAVSLRDNGFVPAGKWLAQSPDNRLLHRWLKDDGD